MNLNNTLQQATAIARNASIEVDWSRNPATEEERRLRIAMIRRVEIESAVDHVAELHDLTERLCGTKEPRSERPRYVASNTFWQLEQLHPDRYFDEEADRGQIGDDLFDALMRWSAANEEERNHNEDLERRKLRALALRDLAET